MKYLLLMLSLLTSSSIFAKQIEAPLKRDVNGDSKISYEEFKQHHQESMKKHFNKLDLNGDGYLTHDEISSAKMKIRDRIHRHHVEDRPNNPFDVENKKLNIEETRKFTPENKRPPSERTM